MKTYVLLNEHGQVLAKLQHPEELAPPGGYVEYNGQPELPIPVPELITSYQLGQLLTKAQHESIINALEGCQKPPQKKKKQSTKRAWLG